MKNVFRGFVKLVIMLLFIAGSVYIGKEAMPLIKLGLDLDGGVSITYRAVADNPTSEQMGDAVYKLQLKAQDYSTEAEVYQEGNNRINIDIPGVNDANAILTELGKPGTLYFVEGELRFPLLATSSEISTTSDADFVAPKGVTIGETTAADLVTGPGVAQNENAPNVAAIAESNVKALETTTYSDESTNLTETSSIETSNSAETVAGYTNTESVNAVETTVEIDNPTVSNNANSILGDNVHLGEGVTFETDANGGLVIGGGGDHSHDIVSTSSVATKSEINPNDYLQYDYTKPPEFDMDQVVVSGTDIASARGGMYTDNYGNTQYVVDLTFTEEGKTKFAEATKRNLGQPIYIIYNGDIVSAPYVQSEIADGRAQITGMGTLEDADRLASTIRIGALPLELEVLRSNVVGAKLGSEAISTSLKAGAIGFGIVCLFMIFVYLLPGIAASLALTMYVGLVIFLTQGFNITLTLPGIAGILLSVGMAVDANVIIFTRIKEEIGQGRSTRQAVNEGYKKALSAIIDGNITTLIAAAVLSLKGTGTVKGFAATLALGIVLSMFTALFITKYILNTFLDLGLDNEKLYGKKVTKKIINFVGFRKIPYMISIVLIVCGIAFMGINAAKGNDIFNFGLDFKGGSSTSITFNENLSISEIDSKVVPIFEKVINSPDIQTQKVENSNQVIVKTRTLTLDEMKTIYDELQDENGFNVAEDDITTENISGAVSTQMRNDALIAVLISTILMLIYIWFRFKDIRFASSAVLALLHDCAVTVGFYAVFRWTVDSTFIACMLTIVGYSINATIVIFDRIREDLGRYRGNDLSNIVNTAVTETFTRSVNTSLTTLIMVIVLYIMGVSSIKAFSLTLIIGIVCGCYSSVCITGPMWFDFKSLNSKKAVAQTNSDIDNNKVNVNSNNQSAYTPITASKKKKKKK